LGACIKICRRSEKRVSWQVMVGAPAGRHFVKRSTMTMQKFHKAEELVERINALKGILTGVRCIEREGVPGLVWRNFYLDGKFLDEEAFLYVYASRVENEIQRLSKEFEEL
jgi:hypothetical protein